MKFTNIPDIATEDHASHLQHDLQDWVSSRLNNMPHDGTLYKLLTGEVDKLLLEEMDNRYRGNQTKMALALGINRGTLRKKMKECGMSATLTPLTQ